MNGPVELLDAAVKLPPEARGAFLDAECGADAGLRAEVQSLLEHLEEARGFMTGSLLSAPIVEPKMVGAGVLAPGTRVSSYRIERVLGEGGMGVVYQAHQDNPGRAVALKVIRPGTAGASVLQRFQREAQLLGRLQHPGIAQIFEAGIARLDHAGDLPFLAMELVDGVPLVRYAREQGLDIRGRLELMAKVCDAVEHAHRRGLIHRDLKPGNILVTPPGQPKVLDFGVARALDQATSSTLATEAGQLIGTLAYMSPEQVGGEPTSLDARSDVYALGVILYELLSGKLPHDVRDRTVLDAARLIRDNEPTRLRSISREFRGDIETIVLRALEKDRDRRYPSAAALGEDLRRFLTGEPILARQDSALYVLNKKLRRYRWAVGAGVVFLALVIGFGAWAAVQARAFRTLAVSEAAAKHEAQTSGERAREQLRTSNIERGRMLALRGELRAAEAALWGAFAEEPGAPDTAWALREVYMRFPCLHTFSAGDPDLYTARFSPDGRILATAGDLGVISLWDTQSGALLRSIRGHKQRLYCVRFSPDGSLLASAGTDSVIRLWNAGDGSPAGELPGHKGTVTEIAFNRGGTRLYSTGQDGMLRVWDVCSRTLLREARTSRVAAWAVRPDADGLFVATCDTSGAVQIRAATTLALVREFQAHAGSAQSVAFSPDGSVLATGGRDSTVALWSTRDWSLVRRADVGVRGVRRAEFSPDGTLMVATGSSTSEVFDARTLEPVGWGVAESQGGWCAEFSPDGRMMVTTSRNPGAARLWASGPFSGTRSVQAHRASIVALAASPDGARIATGGTDGSYVLWDAATLTEIHRWTTTSAVRSVAYSPDGARLASGHANGRVRLTRLDDPAHRFFSFRAHTGNADGLAFFPDGRVVTGGADSLIRVWDPTGRTELSRIQADGPINGITVSPDGRWIAANTSDRVAVVWDAADGSLICQGSERGVAMARNLSFSPDSRRLVLATFNGPVEIWQPLSAAAPEQLLGHTRPVARAVFAGTGDLIASAGQDGLLNIWESSSGRCLASLYTRDLLVQSMVWLQGPNRFALSGMGKLTTWDLEVLDRRLLGHARDIVRDWRAQSLPPDELQRLEHWLESAERGGPR